MNTLKSMHADRDTRIDALSAIVTGRVSDLFLADVQANHQQIQKQIGGSRILAVGGSGSIGAATVRALIPFGPRALHVVDQNENTLVELVRELRSSPDGVGVEDFRALPIDFGSPVMQRLLRTEAPYDCIMNFAALKHVRSEKDVYSLLHMLDTNVLKPARLLAWLNDLHRPYRYFCVSTDKAANPVNVMGASKRVMEHVLFSEEIAPGSHASVTSARFPNVAFSDGSLLEGFLRRLQKQQPLAVPDHSRRFFITLREAGQICLLAASCAPRGHVLVPRTVFEEGPQDLQSVAAAVLRHHGFEPRVYTDEVEARRSVQSDLREGCYPLLVTELNTRGEKKCEEFIGEGEERVDIGMSTLVGIASHPASSDALSGFLKRLEELVSQPGERVKKDEVIQLLMSVIPNFRHVETGKGLDEQA